jgi:uncharacterized protein GlcG (DUF336 family)
MADAAAHEAFAACAGIGYKVSAAVVDRGGALIVMLHGDGAGLHTQEGAERKAYTARTFGSPSADFVKRMKDRAGDCRLHTLPSRARAAGRTADQGGQ